MTTYVFSCFFAFSEANEFCRAATAASAAEVEDSSFDLGVEVAVIVFVGLGLARPLIPRRFLWILPAKTVCDEA
jgi:hypothetical protein